jgi:[ribosomal protein S5]-alanine N-acetyltransferase
MRDFTAGDGRGFRAYHADPRYRALFGSAEAQDGDAEQLLARFAAWAEERPRRNYQLAVVRRDRNAALVGCCGLRRAAAADRVAEMGLELAPDHWGRFGYAVEIAYAVIEFGFGELGLAEITGPTQSGQRTGDAPCRMVRSDPDSPPTGTRLDAGQGMERGRMAPSP